MRTRAKAKSGLSGGVGAPARTDWGVPPSQFLSNSPHFPVRVKPLGISCYKRKHPREIRVNTLGSSFASLAQQWPLRAIRANLIFGWARV